MKSLKNYKRIVSLVLSISIASSVLTPSFAQAGVLDKLKALKKNLSEKLTKDNGKKVLKLAAPIIIALAGASSYILLKGENTLPVNLTRALPTNLVNVSPIGIESILPTNFPNNLVNALPVIETVIPTAMSNAMPSMVNVAPTITSLFAKAMTIARPVGSTLLGAGKFVGDTAFGIGKTLVYDPVKFGIDTTVSTTKFVTKNFSQGFVRTFGQTAAVGAIVGGTILLSSAIALSALFCGYKYGLKPYVKNLNNKLNPRQLGDLDSEPVVAIQPVRKEFTKKFKDSFNNLKSGQFKMFLSNLVIEIKNGASNAKKATVDFLDPKFEDFSKDLEGIFKGGKKKAEETVTKPIVNSVGKIVENVNKVGKALIKEISGNKEEIVVLEESAVNKKHVGRNLSDGINDLKEKIVETTDLPVKFLDALLERGGKVVANRIDSLNSPGYKRNKAFRDICTSIWGESDNRCYYDHLKEACGKSAKELGISGEEFVKLKNEYERLKAELNQRELDKTDPDQNLLSLGTELALTEFIYRGRQFAIVAPTAACNLARIVGSGTGFLWNNYNPYILIGGGVLSTITALGVVVGVFEAVGPEVVFHGLTRMSLKAFIYFGGIAGISASVAGIGWLVDNGPKTYEKGKNLAVSLSAKELAVWKKSYLNLFKLLIGENYLGKVKDFYLPCLSSAMVNSQKFKEIEKQMTGLVKFKGIEIQTTGSVKFEEIDDENQEKSAEELFSLCNDHMDSPYNEEFETDCVRAIRKEIKDKMAIEEGQAKAKKLISLLAGMEKPSDDEDLVDEIKPKPLVEGIGFCLGKGLGALIFCIKKFKTGVSKVKKIVKNVNDVNDELLEEHCLS